MLEAQVCSEFAKLEDCKILLLRTLKLGNQERKKESLDYDCFGVVWNDEMTSIYRPKNLNDKSRLSLRELATWLKW